jgi:hypothetical protein
MARLGVSKKKKSPRATELSQLKKDVQRLTEQLKSCKRELAEGRERETATSEILRVIASSPTDIQPVLDVVGSRVLQNCVPLTMLCFSGSKATVCAGALTVGRCRP